MTDTIDRLFDEVQEYSGYNSDRDEFEAIVDVIKPMIEAQERERLADIAESLVVPARQFAEQINDEDTKRAIYDLANSYVTKAKWVRSQVTP